MATTQRLRHRIRAITDKLRPKDDPLILDQIYRRIRGAKPSRNVFSMMLKAMSAARQLERVDAPASKTKKDYRVKYGYRSGPEPVTDLRTKNGDRQRVKTGFMALARMEKENPKEWERLTNGGRL